MNNSVNSRPDEIEVSSETTDRFTFGAYPFGDRILIGALASGGSILLTASLSTHLAGRQFSAVLVIFLLASFACYRRLLKVHSDVTLDGEGLKRYLPSGKWLDIPWTDIEKVTIRRVYGDNDTVGMKGYYLSLRQNAESSKKLPNIYKIEGAMTRRGVFYNAFCKALHRRGIEIEEKDSGSP
jgi:predicted AAA+ superfamily ATPase